ncbi:SDR family NAD(P)-dependent oxidoreductase [Rheinheimera sp. EpRS3]|uniref:SDR family NAD(P)-dependent oxidoreductase n=1 Tax=Rheinheimera sp. EpRS3 TaxID=1712383 RepID=UPI00074988DF|nr:SDR family NAD(P)-dependent oxidoreductase [Rheinheimera sp. EpRS3]KUM55080.1 hypothetical protein AR688_17715 [Rheinheimera sp. EpRS3]
MTEKVTRLISLWRKLKVWRRVPIGPIVLEFSFLRKTKLRRSKKQVSYVNQSFPASEQQTDLAVVFGVGPGFGYALARRIARDCLRVVLVSRDVNKLQFLMEEIRVAGGDVAAYTCDVTSELLVKKTFNEIVKHHGTPSLVVYGIQSFGSGEAMNIELPAFEAGWKHNCLGAFLVSKEAANLMVPLGRGTIVLIGSTSSVIGREGHLNLVAGRFGQRGLAQVLSRELWPKGIHVCHMMIDADILSEDNSSDNHPQADPNDIVDSVMFLHCQPKTAWTSELDIRPWNEKFWEHC